MELTDQQTLPVAQDEAWAALNDTELLARCIPGCESITPNADGSYDVAITAAVGPVKAKFKGKLRLADVNPPTSYTLHFDAQGGAAGHGKGSAQVSLQAAGANETVLAYSAKAHVGGKLAQVGSRLVDMAAQKMARDFFERFGAELAARHPAPAGALEAGAAAGATAERRGGLLARLVAWLRRQFGRPA
jgi:carbon monoxide dehydrogenase subunit G